MTELLFLTYDTDEAQIIILKQKLISKLPKLSNYTPTEVKSVIEEKVWKKERSIIFFR